MLILPPLGVCGPCGSRAPAVACALCPVTDLNWPGVWDCLSLRALGPGIGSRTVGRLGCPPHQGRAVGGVACIPQVAGVRAGMKWRGERGGPFSPHTGCWASSQGISGVPGTQFTASSFFFFSFDFYSLPCALVLPNFREPLAVPSPHNPTWHSPSGPRPLCRRPRPSSPSPGVSPCSPSGHFPVFP